MPKQRTQYICQQCGYASPRWMGKCPDCSNWNSFQEEQVESSRDSKKKRTIADSVNPVPLTEIVIRPENRMKTGIGEYDRVLGGGIVDGAVILIGGAPGMGKSTLLLQVGGQLAGQGKQILYVSGEESLNQIKLRAERLGINQVTFHLLSETNADVIAALIKKTMPSIVIIDSIQTVFASDLESAPGNISQVRYCGALFTTLAKKLNIPILLVGHVTKEGNLAGPRVLEHLVDCLVLLDGDSQHQYRILRTVKNRFGSTHEIGIFEMRGEGLIQVENPSEHLLSQRRKNTSGSAITVTMEGTRPLMLEVQALVAPTHYGTPQRTASGIDHRRLSILIAVIEKRLGLRLGMQDVFVNAAGGLRLHEPSSDLGIVAAIISSLQDRSIPEKTVFIGEVGLAGEVRAVQALESRIKEADRLGFKNIILPKAGLKSIKNDVHLTFDGVESVEEMIELIK